MATPEYRPLTAISGVVRHVDHPFWEEIMTVAVFMPIRLCEEAGEHLVKVWDKLVQKVIHKDELDAHVADGWHTDAATALEAANTADVEAENKTLQAQIDATKATIEKNKVDGRTKAAREAKKPDTAIDPESVQSAVGKDIEE